MEAASVEQKVENAFVEPNSAKRMKKEPGATTGKSVVVLRNTDVMRRNLTVFMPNTIEMAQLKKADKGQFKTNIQISSKMTEIDIKHKLLENFPILEHQRFYCASAVENRTRLEFHGEPRIWDGHYIKRTIKGNSALYILIEEEKQAQDSGHNSADSEQSKLKRSYDQITSSEQLISGVSSVKMAGLIISSTAQQIPENQPNIFTMPGNPPRGSATYPIMVSGLSQKDMEKSDSQHPGERQVMHQDVLPSLILVPNPLQQSLPMASVIMVPTAGGIAVAPAASGGNNVMTMTSAHQSLGTSPLHAAKGPDVRQTGLQMVSSTLTPQMNSLNISNAASQQSQKLVTAETSITKTNQTVQSGEVIEAPQQALPIITVTASNRNYSVGGQQEVLKFKSPAPSRESRDEKTSSSQGTEKGASVSAVTVDRQHYRSVTFVASDNESSSSDPSADSGIDLSEKSEEPTSQSKDKSLDDAMVIQRHEHKVVKLNEAEWTNINEDGGQGGLPLLSVVASKIRAAVSEKKSIVDKICPESSSMKGGTSFVIILSKPLPPDVECAHAYFGNNAVVLLQKENGFNLTGKIPAAQAPGVVTVRVTSLNGDYLGETLFEYVDEVRDILKRLVYNKDLQTLFFTLWAQRLGENIGGGEKQQETQPPSNITTAGSDVLAMNFPQQIDSAHDRGLESEESGSDCSPKGESLGYQANESNYDADDEASSSGSSGDGDMKDIQVASGRERVETSGVWEQPVCQQPSLQLMFERLHTSQDSGITEDLGDLPFHGQFNSSASLVEQEQVTHGDVCSNSCSTQDNSETPERSYNGPQNTESIDSLRSRR